MRIPYALFCMLFSTFVPMITGDIKTGQTSQHRFLPTCLNKSCQSCNAGGTNSSRFLAGMHSVDIAEDSMPRGMSKKMQQRSLKQQLLVWKDCASDPLNLGRPKSCGFIGRIEESLLCFFCGPTFFHLFADGLRILPCHCFDPNVTTSLFPPPEDQRLRRVPEWGICSANMQGSVWTRRYLPGQLMRIWRGQVKGLPKPLFSSDRARRPKCLPWKHVSWNHLSVAHLHFIFPRF